MSVSGFTVGFIISCHGGEVLLLKKDWPEHNKGRFNGVGGKRKEHETWLACIAREAEEETGLILPEKSWHLLERSFTETGDDLFFYMSMYQGSCADIRRGDAGLAEWHSLNDLPDLCLQDVHRFVEQIRRERSKLYGTA